MKQYNRIKPPNSLLLVLSILSINEISITAANNPFQKLNPLRNALLHSDPYHTCSKKRNYKRIESDKSISCVTKTKPKIEEELYNNNGFYYGIGGTILKKEDRVSQAQEMNLKDPMVITKFLETITEFRENIQDIRDSLQSLRQELNDISQHLKDFGKSKTLDDEDGIGDLFIQTKTQKYDRMSSDIEEWANRLILEGSGEDFGWKDILCNKFFKEKLNRFDGTKCYLKWLPDSRKDADDTTLYPCMKIISTINAPYEQVCTYLSNPLHISEYNDLVIQHEDVEDIAPNSKICWSSCPQVLFLKPRDFVTFCCLKWKNGGDTQLVVSEAVDHESLPGWDGEDNGRFCRAFALRGANFISRHPEHYDKTLIILIAHANPGGNLPAWSIKTAVNALAPIEPFKICHRIEVGARKLMTNASDNEMSMVSNPNSVSSRPGGLSQLGYACFWPHGGGSLE